MERLMSELVNHFRNIMMAKTTKQPEKFIVCTPDELERYKSDAQRVTNGTVLYVMETLCAESSKLKYSAHQRAQTEAVLIRLCSPARSTATSAIIRRLDELEAQLMLIKAQGVTVTAPNVAAPVSEIKVVEEAATNEAATIQQEEDIAEEPPIEEYYGNEYCRRLILAECKILLGTIRKKF
jgi:DNA polymerase-3 subunit gamma/tau